MASDSTTFDQFLILRKVYLNSQIFFIFSAMRKALSDQWFLMLM